MLKEVSTQGMCPAMIWNLTSNFHVLQILHHNVSPKCLSCIVVIPIQNNVKSSYIIHVYLS